MEKTMQKIILFLLVFLFVVPVFAEGKYDIKQMTPEVQNALNGRRDRFDQLRALKSSGAVGENNRGYVEVLKQDGSAGDIVAAENRDRKVIYQTIAEQNGLENAISTIESVFAQVQRDKAGPGEQVQTEDGRWISK
jgi:hypothetical protein